MFNKANGVEQIFKCKIDSKIFFIKLYMANKLINIIINVNSEKNSDYSEYFNNYTLSHLQEINSYFKIFNSLNDIYNDFLKIMNSKNFMLFQNEDETISFIIKVNINDKIRNIELSLTKVKKYNFEKLKKNYIENGMSDLNYELNLIKNRINFLEESQGISKKPNYNINTNITPIFPNMNRIENFITKINQLENESNDKDEKIKILEQKLNFYENNSKKIPSNYTNYISGKKLSSTNSENNINNNYVVNLTKRNNAIYNYSIYSDNFEIQNKNKRNNKKFRPYSSVEKKDYNERKGHYQNDYNNHRHLQNKYKKYLSSDLKNNYDRKNVNLTSVRGDYHDYNIPIVQRENILNLNSRIIFTNKEVHLLLKRISGGNNKKKISLNLLYRASIDGDSEIILKLNCHKKSRTLTLFYTMEGARFGVYIEKVFKKKGYEWFEIPGSSFIISLNNLIYYNVMAKKTSLYPNSDNMLSFGFCSKINNNETNWLIYTSRNNFLKKQYLFGDKNDIYLNLDYKKIVGRNPSYHIKDVEIFDVIIETI